MDQINNLMFFGFNLGFWLTNFACIVALLARKLFYTVTGMAK